MPQNNRYISHFVVFACSIAFAASACGAGKPARSSSRFYFKDKHGRRQSAEIVTRYRRKKIVHPLAKIDPRIDPKLRRAATIAEERAHAHSRSRCWQYVKQALLASGAIHSYPKTAYAKQAGQGAGAIVRIQEDSRSRSIQGAGGIGPGLWGAGTQPATWRFAPGTGLSAISAPRSLHRVRC